MKYLWQNISIEHILCARILTNLKYSIGRAWFFSFKWVLLVSFILHYVVNLTSTSLITLPVSWWIIILNPTIFTFTPLPSAFSHTTWQASSEGTITALTSLQSWSRTRRLAWSRCLLLCYPQILDPWWSQPWILYWPNYSIHLIVFIRAWLRDWCYVVKCLLQNLFGWL